MGICTGTLAFEVWFNHGTNDVYTLLGSHSLTWDGIRSDGRWRFRCGRNRW